MNARRTLYRDAEVTFLCDYLFNGEKVALHLNIEEGAWSPSKFKRYHSIFTNIVAPNLKSEGYNEVYATPLEHDKKAQKLIKMFGLHQYGQNMGLVLMKKEI
jgi:hypothetical protein